MFLSLAIPMKYSSESTGKDEDDELIYKFWINQIFSETNKLRTWNFSDLKPDRSEVQAYEI